MLKQPTAMFVRIYKNILDSVLSVGCFVFFVMLSSIAHSAILIAGPITASNVTVTGNVTMSSVTVSTMNITNMLNLPTDYSGIPGRILQMKFSSSTVTTNVSTTQDWTPVPSIARSISLIKATDALMISLNGGIYCGACNFGFLTIFRDGQNLATPDSGDQGFSGCYVSPSNDISVASAGITIFDYPGDTAQHTYEAYVRTNAVCLVGFPQYGTGYMLLEEISQ